jgi:hypothetical protein
MNPIISLGAHIIFFSMKKLSIKILSKICMGEFLFLIMMLIFWMVMDMGNIFQFRKRLKL